MNNPNDDMNYHGDMNNMGEIEAFYQVPDKDIENQTIEEPIKFVYHSRTEANLKQIAVDLYNGLIFTDRDAKPYNGPIFMVFLPLIFMEKDHKEAYMKDLGMIFGYYKDALPVSNNGQPCFMIMHRLDTADAAKVIQYLGEYTEKMKRLREDWSDIGSVITDQTY